MSEPRSDDGDSEVEIDIGLMEEIEALIDEERRIDVSKLHMTDVELKFMNNTYGCFAKYCYVCWKNMLGYRSEIETLLVVMFGFISQLSYYDSSNNIEQSIFVGLFGALTTYSLIKGIYGVIWVSASSIGRATNDKFVSAIHPCNIMYFIMILILFICSVVYLVVVHNNCFDEYGNYKVTAFENGNSTVVYFCDIKKVFNNSLV